LEHPMSDTMSIDITNTITNSLVSLIIASLD
jgi:hypothetical protein